jgi:hypothetical protein
MFEHGRHQYYRIRKEVIGDIKQVIASIGPEQVQGRKSIIPGRSWRILRVDSPSVNPGAKLVHGNGRVL